MDLFVLFNTENDGANANLSRLLVLKLDLEILIFLGTRLNRSTLYYALI